MVFYVVLFNDISMWILRFMVYSYDFVDVLLNGFVWFYLAFYDLCVGLLE